VLRANYPTSAFSLDEKFLSSHSHFYLILTSGEINVSTPQLKSTLFGKRWTTFALGISLGFMATQASVLINEEGKRGPGKLNSAQLPEETVVGLSLTNRLTNAGGTIDAFNSVLEDESITGYTGKQSAYYLATDHTLAASISARRFFQAHLALPLYYQEISTSDYEPVAFAPGDLRYGLTLALPFGGGNKPFAIALSGGGSVGTSQPGNLVVPRRLEYITANRSADGAGSHAAGTQRDDWHLGAAFTVAMTKMAMPLPVALHVNVGNRKTSVFYDSDEDFYDILSWGAGFEGYVSEGLTVFGQYAHDGRWDGNRPNNTEVHDLGLGLSYRFPIGFAMTLGADWGIGNGGYNQTTFVDDNGDANYSFGVKGTPDAQIYFALTQELQVGAIDADGDGIPNSSDQCPTKAEDADGFEDEDGCPDLDNDGDGIPDTQDACKNQKEDVDGFEDTDGCPDLDNDKDGIPDAQDKCPLEAEDKDSFEDADGCPEADNDHDGIPDDKDACPNEAQGPHGKDGCPARDADLDGIADDLDKCPNEKEIVNGFQDEDGCPDKAPVEEKTLVLKGINFETGKAVLTPDSYSALDDLATQLNAAKQVELEVSGHTDSRGGKAANQSLSQARAQAVADYLIAKGVDSKRLTVKGYGPDRPIASNNTAAGRLQNRRVEFNRLK
jgi:outer membrane protein OmpA-like peptidoglycan-associated protein